MIARSLGPSGKGVVALVSTLAAYSSILISLGLEVATVRFVGKDPGSARGTAAGVLPLGLLLGVVGGGGGVAAILFLYGGRLPGFAVPSALLLVGLTPIVLVTSYLRAVLRGLGRLVETSLVPVATSFLYLVAIVSIGALHLRADAVLLAMAGAVVTTATLIGFLALREHVLVRPSAWGCGMWRRLTSYGLKNHVGTLLQGVNYRLDLFFVGALLSFDQVGFYAVAVAIAEVTWIVPNALGTVLLQRAAAGREEDSIRLTEALTRLTSAVLLISGIALLAGGSYVLGVVFGPTFVPAGGSLTLLLPGVWALGLWKNLTMDLSGRGYPFVKSYTAGAAAAVTVLLDLLLIPRFGIEGAAVASSIAYFSALIGAGWSYRRVTGSSVSVLIIPRVSDVRFLRAAIRRLIRRRMVPAS